MNMFKSDISGKEFPEYEMVSAKSIRESLLLFIQKQNPNFEEDKFLSISELNYFRERYISEYLLKEVGELGMLEKTVLSSLKDRSTLSDKIDDDDLVKMTFGQRIADKVAAFGGSWTFIISFGIFIALWITINIFFLANDGFDPYPFILLNLILSCIAALQAPVIMMSQNRQEEKDRERAKKDYMINLKSELEIRILHEKMDHLILHQHQELMEIQKVQVEMMNDLFKKLENKK